MLICQEKTAVKTGDFEFLANLFINSLYSSEYPPAFWLSAGSVANTVGDFNSSQSRIRGVSHPKAARIGSST